MRWQSMRMFRNCLVPFWRPWQLPLQTVTREKTSDPWYWLIFRMKYDQRITRDHALKTEVNRLPRSVTCQVNEWRNGQWSVTLESPDPENQSCGKWLNRWWEFPLHHPPLITLGGIALSDSEEADILADSLVAQFQLVNDPSEPAVIQKVDEMLRAYFLTPDSKNKLTL